MLLYYAESHQTKKKKKKKVEVGILGKLYKERKV